MRSGSTGGECHGAYERFLTGTTGRPKVALGKVHVARSHAGVEDMPEKFLQPRPVTANVIDAETVEKSIRENDTLR